MFLFFNQKTAYERRIRYWSSDVCSSDLTGERPRAIRPLPRCGERQGGTDRGGDSLDDARAAFHAQRAGRRRNRRPDDPRGRLADAELCLGQPRRRCVRRPLRLRRSEEHTSELQSLMRISYAVFSLKKKTIA